jgi:hypothetical protein
VVYHLGPAVEATISGPSVHLEWDDVEGARGRATLQLPAALTWSLVKGSTDPVLGWYSAGFGERAPSTTVIGEGVCSRDQRLLLTTLQFAPGGELDSPG